MSVFDKKSINQIGSATGVYLFKKKKQIIYIGKSINIKARIKSHFENAKKDIKERKIIENFDTIETIKTNYEFDALILESKLINKYKPQYNSRWRDDKSYLYIKITKDKNYPKIFISRKEKSKKDIYYGPFPSIRNVEYILKQIRKIFPYCSQNKISKKACFYNKINLCNPCPSRIEQISDRNLKKVLIKQYKNNIHFIKQILEGKTNIIERNLLKNIQNFSKNNDFENALTLRNKLILFHRLILQQILTNTDYDPSINFRFLKDLVIFFNKYFKSLNNLHRIECYDISNISFQYSTASMVVAINGELDKSKYRKFKIKRKDNHSDLFMLEEVLTRRFNNQWQLPNLIIVDGGTPQVITALKILKKFNLDIPLIGLAKNPNRIIIGVEGLPSIKNLMSDPIFRILILLRDESHRFAKKYHVYLRDKKFVYN